MQWKNKVMAAWKSLKIEHILLWSAETDVVQIIAHSASLYSPVHYTILAKEAPRASDLEQQCKYLSQRK